MKSCGSVMLDRRHALTLGLGAATTFALAACNGGTAEDAGESPAEPASDSPTVTLYATVTDAGQYLDRMVIDYGDTTVSDVDVETYEVLMDMTVQYGELEGEPYPFYDATVPVPIVKTDVNGGVVTAFFRQDAAPTLTWLDEGRNYPGKLAFTITQTKEITTLTPDKRELALTAEYACDVESYEGLIDEEVAKFEDVQADINYRLYKGTDDALIVWFHGNGEGDFPTKDTNNNIAQVLANRGTVAWASEEAQDVFGDATVMAFQAPNVWYRATLDGLLEQAYDEIQEVVSEQGIDPEKLYVSGCSAGGFMTTRMIIAYPDLFKAAMINCPALDVADLRAEAEGCIPTDEELASLRSSDTKIWLVQGETDSSVNPEECSKRIWNIITEGAETSEATYEGTEGIASGFTTYETADDKYKLTLYQTVDTEEAEGTLGDTRLMGSLVFAEDYDQDGELEEVKYNDHWSWIYTLRNNPEDAAGEHIWEWAAK